MRIEMREVQVYRNDKEGNIIRGVGLLAFIHSVNYSQTSIYSQTIIHVFEDGMIIVRAGLITFEEFKRKVAQGQIVTQVPKGARISCDQFYDGRSTLEFYVDVDEFVKEVEDTINMLQGKETVSETCVKAFFRFLIEPIEKNRRRLRESYEAIPKHLRCYVLGDMDNKDFPIRDCIENANISHETIEWCGNRYEHYRGWYK
jgi:DNA-directed RNA polymerase subunit E'/Rpb7